MKIAERREHNHLGLPVVTEGTEDDFNKDTVTSIQFPSFSCFEVKLPIHTSSAQSESNLPPHSRWRIE